MNTFTRAPSPPLTSWFNFTGALQRLPQLGMMVTMLLASMSLPAQAQGKEAHDFVNQGIIHYVNGDTEQAKTEIEQGLSDFPDDPQLLKLKELFDSPPPQDNQEQDNQEQKKQQAQSSSPNQSQSNETNTPSNPEDSASENEAQEANNEAQREPSQEPESSEESEGPEAESPSPQEAPQTSNSEPTPEEAPANAEAPGTATDPTPTEPLNETESFEVPRTDGDEEDDPTTTEPTPLGIMSQEQAKRWLDSMQNTEKKLPVSGYGPRHYQVEETNNRKDW